MFHGTQKNTTEFFNGATESAMKNKITMCPCLNLNLINCSRILREGKLNQASVQHRDHRPVFKNYFYQFKSSFY